MSEESWKQEPIASVSEVIMGQSPESKYYSEQEIGLPFLQGCSEFTGQYPSANLYCSQPKKVAPPNSILFSVRAPVGRTNLADRDYIIGRGLAALSANSISQDYLWHYLNYLENDFRSASQGSTFEAINSRELRNWLIEFPINIEEQTQIATVLSTVDRAIAQTETLIAKQQRIKTGLMQDMLTKGIDENGNIRSEATHRFKDSPLGRIPAEWEVDLLDNIADRGSGHTPNKRQSKYWNGGIKWVSLADSSKLDDLYIYETKKEISQEGLKNSSAVLHPAETVILSRDAGVGKSAILACEMAVSQHFMAWKCKNSLSPYYLYYWLQKDKQKFEGIASGSTIVTIGLQFFRQYTIAFPGSVEEQNEISKVLVSMENVIDKHKTTLLKLRCKKLGLMQDLLTGKVRVAPLLQK